MAAEGDVKSEQAYCAYRERSSPSKELTRVISHTLAHELPGGRESSRARSENLEMPAAQRSVNLTISVDAAEVSSAGRGGAARAGPQTR
jgi:hypothetical protein